MALSSEDAAFLNGTSRHTHRKETRKMRWWYESLADFMIANPRATQGDIAKQFGRAECTISTIVNADSFKAYFRQRRDELAKNIDSRVRDKLLNVAEFGLELMLEHLEKKRDTIPLPALQNTLDSTLKALGFGVQSGPAVVVNNNTVHEIPVAVSIEDLEAARLALRRNQQQLSAPNVIEHDVREEILTDNGAQE